jgi:hypothetical protein
VAGIQAGPVSCGAVPRAREGMASVSFGRRVTSCGWSGLPSPTRASGGSSAGMAAIRPSPGSSWAERIGAQPSPVLLVCGSRSRSPSPAWEPMARCSGRLGWPICICGQVILRGGRGGPSRCERCNEARAAREGGSGCHRSGRRRMGPRQRRAKRRSRRKNAEAEEEDRARKVNLRFLSVWCAQTRSLLLEGRDLQRERACAPTDYVELRGREPVWGACDSPM